MKKMIEKLKLLDDIIKSDDSGLYSYLLKLSDEENETYFLACNYILKINYSTYDLNKELDEFIKTDSFLPKDILYVIALVDWIKEASHFLFELVNMKKINFNYSKENILSKYKKYFEAIRSFIIAHPMNTTKHSEFNLDGNYICCDLRKSDLGLSNKDTYSININGLFNKRDDNDFSIMCFSQKDDHMKYEKSIGCKFEDIYNVARLYIDKIYELDSFLSVKNSNGDNNEQD